MRLLAIILIFFTIFYFLQDFEFKRFHSAQPLEKPIFQPPTASEIFKLRSECADLGDKLSREMTIKEGLSRSVKSRYNPKTNRCFVLLDETTANLSVRINENSFYNYLFDGQTKELLASWSLVKGESSGDVFDDAYNEKHPSYTEKSGTRSSNYIKSKMADDHEY